MKNVFRAAITILALACGPANAIGMCGSGPRVNCIVDGDTFWLNGEKFRAVGYDTPETTTNLCGGSAERQLGQQASRRLMQLFNETQITLLRQGEDRYGRTLVVVRSDGVNVGDILIGEAWREAGLMGASSGVELVSREFGLGYRLADSFAPKPPNCENENLPSPSGP